MDRLFEESFVRPASVLFGPLAGGTLAVDMYDAGDAIVVKTAVPGVKPEDLDISITGDTLTIKGEAREESEVKAENYIRRERRMGSFCRSLALPTQVNADKAEATFEHGVLTLTIPKAEEVKPKVIKVKTR